jgi:RNA polymerase sigma-70 factor (ECF subfamily)
MTPQEIYRRYGAVAYRRARQILGDDQAAKDACQEVFLRLFRALPEFERASPVTWIYTVTTNYCLNLIRDEQRHRMLLEARAAARPPATAAPSLATLLRGFPEELQAIAVYYFIDEMSQAEIADLLGISQRTVSSRLGAFRDLAKKAWTSDAVEEPC